VVIPNLVYALEDQRWSALDARPLYAWCKPIGYLYAAQLRYELTRRLGVQWQPAVNGMAEMSGFLRDALRAFSTRRREIEDELKDAGRSGGKAAQRAAYKTRAPKDTTLDAVDLVDGWRRRAEDFGLDATTLAAVTERGVDVVVPVLRSAAAEALYEHLAQPDGLTAQRSTFDIRNVIEAVCQALPNGGQAQDVLALAEGFLESAHVVPLDSAPLGALRRSDGRLVPSGGELERFRPRR
jgi:hypothetical protein